MTAALAGRHGGLVVPAYFHPAVRPGAWRVLAESAARLRLVVLNVASGCGELFDDAFRPAVAAVRAAGVPVAGYVDTDYGARSATAALAELNRYQQWYGVDGVFFDRVAATADQLDHYAALAGAARLLGAEVVAFNHGVYPVPGYVEHADLLGTFEGPWRVYRELVLPRWPREHPADRFVHLVYAVPAEHLGDAVALAERRHAVACATAEALPNPWCGLPDGVPKPEVF